MGSPEAGRRLGASAFREFLYEHPPLLRAGRRLSNARYVVYHYVDAAAPRATVARAVRGFPRFLRDRRNYERMSGERLRWHEDNPQLLDWSETTPGTVVQHGLVDSALSRYYETFGKRERISLGSGTDRQGDAASLSHTSMWPAPKVP
jgi:hypothetical protein